MYTASPRIRKNRQDIHIDLFTIFNFLFIAEIKIRKIKVCNLTQEFVVSCLRFSVQKIRENSVRNFSAYF